MGLAGLLFMAAFGLTGALLVWPTTFDAMVHPARYPSVSTRDFVPDTAFLTKAAAALPMGDRISGLRVMQGQGAILVAGEARGLPPLGLGPANRVQLWLHPQTGELLDRQERAGGFIWALHALHGHMLLKQGGRIVVALLGAGLLALSAIGLWLWWPGLRSVRQGLRWRKQFSRSMNLHRQAGAIVALILLVEAFTGAWLALPTLFAQIVSPGSLSGRAEASEGPPTTRPAASTMLNADQAVRRARTLTTPDARLTTIFFPDDAKGLWAIGLAAPSARPLTIMVDDRTGSPSLRPAPRPDRAERAAGLMMTIHAGRFGLAGQIIVFLSGLVLTLLSVTGLLLWLQGRALRRRRLRRT